MPDPTASTPTAFSRRAIIIAAAFLALAAVVPFLPALRAGFSDFDDHGFLLEADDWRGLGPSNLAWMFTTFRLGHYQPLTYFSYAIDYTLFGLEPAAYHATNIGLHAVSAVLVFALVLRVLGLETLRGWATGVSGTARVAIAAFAGALWAAHPLRVESVAWITERRDLLSCSLLLGTTLAYLSHGTSGEKPARGRWWWACLLLLALSLLAKAWGMTFFAVAILMDVRPLRRLGESPREWFRPPSRTVLLEKLPLAGLGVGAAILATRAQTDGAARTLAEWGVVERVMQSAYGLSFYIERTLLPRGLSPLRELPELLNPTDPKWLVPLLVGIVAAAGLVALRRRRAGLAVAVACYAVLVSPVLGILQSGAQLVADRYAHIPTIPLFVAGACGLAALAERWGRGSRGVALGGGAGAVVCIVVLGALSWRQSTLWQSDAMLWQSSIDRGVDGPQLRNHLANHLEGRGKVAEAEAQYRESIRLRPTHPDSLFGLGSVLNKQNRFPEAIEAFTRAAQAASDPAPALMMLGVIQISRMKRGDLAIAAFQAAVEVTEKRGNPERIGRPYLLLAAALGQGGDEAGAIPLLKKAAQFPDSRAEAEGHLREMGLLK